MIIQNLTMERKEFLMKSVLGAAVLSIVPGHLLGIPYRREPQEDHNRLNDEEKAEGRLDRQRGRGFRQELHFLGPAGYFPRVFSKVPLRQ